MVLSRVENLVLDAIGKDGAYLNGVGYEAPYPSFSGVKRPTTHGVEANGDTSLMSSYSNNNNNSSWNQSLSQNNTQSFENYGKQNFLRGR